MKKFLLFTAGGVSYVGLEFLWRGRSHSSMFFAGGLCFLLLGLLQKTASKLTLPVRALAGAGIITAVELVTGLLVNRNFTVWDYRQLPGNFLGQICLPYTLMWLPVSLFAMSFYKKLDNILPGK